MNLRAPRRIRITASALWAAVSLGGCVSLLPKQPPVQLYRLGQEAAVPNAGPQAPLGPQIVGRGQRVVGVVLAQVSLPPASQGDGLLTIHGEEAAYIAGARWVTPAALMFQADAERAFAGAAHVRLIGRSDVAAASALLRLDVVEFDIRYDGPAGVEPRAVVSLNATLSSADGRRLIQRSFISAQPAGEDRVSAMVRAYDAASQAVSSQVADWTEANAPALAATLDPGSPPAALPRHAVRGLPSDRSN